MGRRPSLALLIIIAGAFFLLGLYTAFLQDGPTEEVEPTPSATPAPATEAQTGDTTLLFLGVDELNSGSPQLEAIWFLTYQSPAPDIFLLGIPLTETTDGDPPQEIRRAFAWNPDQGPSAEFLDRLFRAVPLEPDAIIVLDRTAFAAAIDYLGGVTLNDSSFTGQEVLGILSLTDGDPTASLSLQRRLLAALSRSAADIGETPELTPLIEQIPEHMFISNTVNEMVGLVTPLLPIRPETTHIELY